MGDNQGVNPSGSSGDVAFDSVAGMLDYPMFVVTASAGGEMAGCLVGFTSQVSIDPRRFLVALSTRNHTFRVAERAEHLAVHLLSGVDPELARLFGEHTGDQTDKFTHCAWHADESGVPILDAAPAWFIGRILDRLPFGDHVGFVLQPTAGQVRTDPPAMITFADVRDLEAGHDA
ncbi:flavin reductase family protein [Rhodococcus kronopolitis]|uniref:Flavin reductase family protein n=1 Tax=Rhodococcus kronopolitis TaxID=1460226 RepID=A0ABV9FSV1_9NOCA